MFHLASREQAAPPHPFNRNRLVYESSDQQFRRDERSDTGTLLKNDGCSELAATKNPSSSAG
jgi:hypothetical protein